MGPDIRQSVYEPPLDPGIAYVVNILRKHGVETFESCQGGPGHAYPRPAVRFRGGYGAGWIALGVALQHGFPVSKFRLVWMMVDQHPDGPFWEMEFATEALMRLVRQHELERIKESHSSHN